MRTVMDADGNRFQVPEVINATIEHLIPPKDKTGWYCTKPCDSEPMDLFPISRSVNPEFWECRKCHKQVTIAERDRIFETIRQNILDKYTKDIEVFSYDRKTNTFDVKGQYEGRSRHTAKRKKVTHGRKQDLVNQLLNTVESTLSIQVDNIKEYWIE